VVTGSFIARAPGRDRALADNPESESLAAEGGPWISASTGAIARRALRGGCVLGASPADLEGSMFPESAENTRMARLWLYAADNPQRQGAP
jgi:hypothetical protein